MAENDLRTTGVGAQVARSDDTLRTDAVGVQVARSDDRLRATFVGVQVAFEGAEPGPSGPTFRTSTGGILRGADGILRPPS